MDHPKKERLHPAPLDAIKDVEKYIEAFDNFKLLLASLPGLQEIGDLQIKLERVLMFLKEKATKEKTNIDKNENKEARKVFEKIKEYRDRMEQVVHEAAAVHLGKELDFYLDQVIEEVEKNGGYLLTKEKREWVDFLE